MKITAIIAEYNPFHNGHLYQINETRHQTDADFILVIMSGDFVQRGAPSLCNKYIRTQMALACGADAVIELPAIYATSSAEFFAGGAISLLNHLNVVNTLSFGSESGKIDALMGCARILVKNSPDMKAGLKDNLKHGLPYPAAMAKTVSDAFLGMDTLSLANFSGSNLDQEELNSLFSSPNNILGLEYCKALLVTQSSLRPFTLKREGNSHHDLSLKNTSSSPISENLASASAIRNALNNSKNSKRSVRKYVPDIVYDLFLKNDLLSAPITEDAFSGLLHYKLLLERDQGFADYLGCSPDLSDKICKNLLLFTGFTDFCRQLKSKEVTYARLSRMFMHILLNMKTPDYFCPSFCERRLFTPYARLLGFRKEATPLLSAIKKSSSIPLLSKPASASSLLDEKAFALLKQDIFCASVYESVVSQRTRKPPLNELKQSPIIFIQ